MTAHDSNRYRKIPARERTVPNLVTALALPDEVTSRLAQQFPEFPVEMRSHSGDRWLGFA